MFSDRFALYFCCGLTIAFIAFCIIDVTGLYPLMENVAIQLLLILAFSLLVLNTFITRNQDDDSNYFIKENLSETEIEDSEYRQI